VQIGGLTYHSVEWITVAGQCRILTGFATLRYSSKTLARAHGARKPLSTLRWCSSLCGYRAHNYWMVSPWRACYGFAIALIAAIGGVAAFVAASTGESLKASVSAAAWAGRTRASSAITRARGNTAEFFAIVFAACVVGFCRIDRCTSDSGSRE
jgi:hypothetical protein